MSKPEHDATESILNVRDIQMIFAKADEQLDEQARREHPIHSWEEIKRMYPNQWVAIVVTGVDKDLTELAGRVFGSSSDKLLFEEDLKSLRQEHPGILFSTHFFGTHVPEKVAFISYPVR